MPPDVCWWGTGASRVAVWSHSPCQPDFRAVSIAWILLFGPRAGTSMARAAQASPPRPGGASGLRGWNVAPGSRCVRNRQAGRGPHDAVDHHHGAGVTVRTLPQRPPGQRLEPLAVVTGRFGRCGWRHPEQLPAALEFPRAVTVAEEAVVPDAMEPARQDMDQETADELRAIERHHLLAIAVPVILPAEADLAVVHGQQPVVGDGDTVGVASDIVEDLGWSGKRPLRVDHPLGVPDRRQIPPERGRFMKVAVRGEKVQLPSGERLPQVVQEQAPEHLRQHRDRKKVSWPAGDPARSIRRDPAARNQKMNMRMVLKGLPPGVQHTQEADLCAEMLWIGRDLTQRLRPRPEQHIVDNGLVLEGDDLDLLGHREHDVEVGHVEQFGLTVREPLGARETLALWATFCGTSCKRRVDGHNRRTPRRDRQERRCGNSRSRTWRAAARWTATRHSDHGK